MQPEKQKLEIKHGFYSSRALPGYDKTSSMCKMFFEDQRAKAIEGVKGPH